MDVPGLEQCVEPKKFACMNCRTRKLKCDSVRPICSTCSKNRQACEYVPPSKRRVNKRRNIKQLEDRLLSLEGKLISLDPSRSISDFVAAQPGASSELPNPNDQDGLGQGSEAEPFQPQFTPPSSKESQESPVLTMVDSPDEEDFSPSNAIVSELHEVYFTMIHPSVPILHKARYLASFSNPSALQPSQCLRYAVWAIAALVSEKHAGMESELYQCARKYVQEDEMSDTGQKIMSLDHVRFWCIVADYETRKMLWNRGWSSLGRAIRLAQLLELHALDDPEDLEKKAQKHLNLRDWTDIEEARRLFWFCFRMDRYSGVITGRPMTINEDDEPSVHLPSLETAYQTSQSQPSISFSTARTSENLSNISAFGASILLADAYGLLSRHLHRKYSKIDQSDVAGGKFWKRHWELDSKFVRLQLVIPGIMRNDPDVLESENIAAVIQSKALTIGLYKAAVIKAETYGLDESIARQCLSRIAGAAEEIVADMRRVIVVDMKKWPCFLYFCLHMTIDSLVQTMKDDFRVYQARQHLETLLVILKSLRLTDPFIHSIITAIQLGLRQQVLGASCTNLTASPVVENDTYNCRVNLRNSKSLGGMLDATTEETLYIQETLHHARSRELATQPLSQPPQFIDNNIPAMFYNMSDAMMNPVQFQTTDTNMGADFEMMATTGVLEPMMEDFWFQPG